MARNMLQVSSVADEDNDDDFCDIDMANIDDNIQEESRQALQSSAIKGITGKHHHDRARKITTTRNYGNEQADYNSLRLNLSGNRRNDIDFSSVVQGQDGLLHNED